MHNCIRLCLTLSSLLLLPFCGYAHSNERAGEGLVNGYLGACPLHFDNLTIPKNLYGKLGFVLHGKNSRGPYQRKYNYLTAGKLHSDPNFDRKKKVIFFISGYLDSTTFPFATFIGDAYTKRGNYNVILVDTNRFTTVEYAVASSISKDIAVKVAKVIIKLYKSGISPKNIELIGLSLGCHTAGLVGKKFHELTGKKVSRITGLDPSGPCFRHVPAAGRLDKGDADYVDVIHTNVDAFGMPMQMGHVDYYVNGAEWQPPFTQAIPCLVFCSHIRSYFLFIASMDYQDKFVALRCNSIQQARDMQCFDNQPPETTIFGFNGDRRVGGIFYLGTSGAYPYYLGARGVVKGTDYNTTFFSLYDGVKQFPTT